MYRYRNTSGQRVYVRKAGVHVDPGEVFDSPVRLDSDAFEEVKAGKTKDAGSVPAIEEA